MVTTARGPQSTSQTERWRLFAAVQVNDAVREVVSNAQRQLGVYGGPLRWVVPALAHVTLQFYGETPAALVPALRARLAGIARNAAPLTLSTGAIGVFPSAARARVLWLGVTGDIAPLNELARAVSGTAALVPGADAKPFRPHITLGRVRGRGEIRDIAQQIAAVHLSSAAFAVEHMALVRSILAPSGPSYTTVAECVLGAAPRSEVREHG
jgi:2'-5' RNA ligase